MKVNYRIFLLILVLGLLTGCQSYQLSGGNVFFLRPSDNELRTTVTAALLNNPELASVPIHVETQQGMVMLSGYVKTIRQSDMAGDIASKVPGVKTVQNELIVRK